jgi:hypothetical protein
MPPEQVQHRLDSLRSWRVKTFPLSTPMAPLQPEPVYIGGRLAALVLKLENPGLASPDDYRSVVNTLATTYGPDNHPHGPKLYAYSWFDGGMEIEVWPLPNGDYRVTYADLHLRPQLAASR